MNSFFLPSCDRVHRSGSVADARTIRPAHRGESQWVNSRILSVASRKSFPRAPPGHYYTVVPKLGLVEWQPTHHRHRSKLLSIIMMISPLNISECRWFVATVFFAKEISETMITLRSRHLSKLNHVIYHRLGVRLLSRVAFEVPALVDPQAYYYLDRIR